ncbi:hypothetical protein [Candidatus Sororendozoicomonas aggregata]
MKNPPLIKELNKLQAVLDQLSRYINARLLEKTHQHQHQHNYQRRRKF